MGLEWGAAYQGPVAAVSCLGNDKTQADRRDRGRKERGPCGYQAVPHLILCAPANGNG